MFVAVEGIDGAGKTTTVPLAAEMLRARGIPIWTTKEPAHLLGIPCDHPDPRVAALLYAADRLLHCAEIQRHLDAGEVVICDRYYWSSMAVQGPAIRGREVKGVDWVETVNDGALYPDLWVLIDLPVDEAVRRIRFRSDEDQPHEARTALALADYVYRCGCPDVTISGLDTVEERARQIVDAIVSQMEEP